MIKKSSKSPAILKTEKVCEGKLFKIESVHLRFSNGQKRCFERIQGWNRGSVMIVPMLDDSTVLLIREYAVGVEDYVLGFPKGAIQNNESPLVTANRELKEEVGYGAKKLRILKQFASSPGYLTALMQFVLAESLYPSKAEGDEPEPLEIIPWSLGRVDALLDNPAFIESRSIAALLWVERMWRAKRSS